MLWSIIIKIMWCYYIIYVNRLVAGRGSLGININIYEYVGGDLGCLICNKWL